MPIPFVCPMCQKPLLAPDGAEGRQVRCPHCQGVAPVPVSAPAPPPPPPVPPPLPAPDPFSAAMLGQEPAPAGDGHDWSTTPAAPENTLALDPRWQSVSRGLQLIRYGTMIGAGVAVVLFF